MEGEVRGRPSLRFPPPSRVAALFHLSRLISPLGHYVYLSAPGGAQPLSTACSPREEKSALERVVTYQATYTLAGPPFSYVQPAGAAARCVEMNRE